MERSWLDQYWRLCVHWNLWVSLAGILVGLLAHASLPIAAVCILLVAAFGYRWSLSYNPFTASHWWIWILTVGVIMLNAIAIWLVVTVFECGLAGCF